MAANKMSTLAIVTIFSLAGLIHGEEKDCTMDQVKVLSKMVTCITENHPEYFLTVLTKMDNPAAMEKPDFMCSNPGMMSAMVDCFLQYVEGCMPPSVASQVVTVMPSHQTVQRGIKFLCNHRKDFEQPCVTSQLSNLIQCFSNKIQAFSHATSSRSSNMQDTLCSALRVEEKCLATNLAGCPANVMSDLMSGLLAFFPSENCHIKNPRTNNILIFKPEGQH
ncbi:uncharacterized protein [Littorina saxatilis]|uniref:Uncharacterized protein n=1 Tax=Littorina saxatilis TaxID=31220 RepID=A0AAN9BWP9_9CAEN